MYDTLYLTVIAVVSVALSSVFRLWLGGGGEGGGVTGGGSGNNLLVVVVALLPFILAPPPPPPRGEVDGLGGG